VFNIVNCLTSGMHHVRLVSGEISMMN